MLKQLTLIGVIDQERLASVFVIKQGGTARNLVPGIGHGAFLLIWSERFASDLLKAILSLVQAWAKKGKIVLDYNREVDLINE